MIRTGRWDRKYLELAKYISQWSKDPSMKVGAVLVNYELEQEFIGYNGFPRGVGDIDSRYEDRPTKYKFIVHAEVNAILKAGKAAKGSVIYVWPSFNIPNICNECAKVAIQAGVTEVVGYIPNHQDEGLAERWRESILVAKQMLEESGVKYTAI